MMPAGQSADLNRVYRCISELNQVMNRGVELSVLLDTIVRETALLLSAETTSVMLLNEQGTRLLCSASEGLTPMERAGIKFRPGEGIAGWSVENGRSVMVDDVSIDPRFIPLPNQSHEISSMICIPLMIRQRPIGVICATHPERSWFSRDHEELLCFLANSIVLDVENARLYRMAITDPLTGVFNRQHLAERLKEEVDRAHRYDMPLSVLMIDVDRFKRVNDQFGHQAGDRVLTQVARRLLEVTREVDLVARYGGEEFVILLPNTCREGGEQAARRLLEAMHSDPFEIAANAKLRVTMSIGGAVLNFKEEPRDILARADAALYQAKREGRDRFVFNWLSFAGVS